MMPPRNDQNREDWLDEIISLTEAAALRKVSIDTLRSEIRKGKLKQIKLSERKRGMTRREALRSVQY
jgi:hypothetical protein